MSRAKSGEPCRGFRSRLKGEKPQSSVAPRRFAGMCLAAATSRLLRRLNLRIERIDNSNEAELRHSICVFAAVLRAQLVYRFLILLAGALDEEVVRVHEEHALKERAPRKAPPCCEQSHNLPPDKCGRQCYAAPPRISGRARGCSGPQTPAACSSPSTDYERRSCSRAGLP